MTRVAVALSVCLAVFLTVVLPAIPRAGAPPPPSMDGGEGCDPLVDSSDAHTDGYGVTHNVLSQNAPMSSYDIFYSNSHNPAPVQLTFTSEDSLGPEVWMEANFTVVYVAWFEVVANSNESQVWYTTSNDNGTTWTSPMVIGWGDPCLPWDMSVVDDRLLGTAGGATVVEEFVPSEIYRQAQQVFLARYAFDSRQGEPALPPELRIDSYPPGVDGYYLVQVNGLSIPDWPDAIAYTGAEIKGYSARLAYIVKMNESERAAVASLPFVRWIGIFHPGYRVHPSFDGATGMRVMIVTTFTGENVTSIGAAITSLGAQVNLTSSLEGVGTIAAYANASLIDDIARVNGVAHIGPDYLGKPGNSDARWVIQSGNTVTRATPIHDHGIDGYHPWTGMRERIAVADTGVRVDHESMTGAVYTKVVATRDDWRNLGGGYCPGDDNGHGTAVASSVAGDAPTKESYSPPSDNNRRDGAVFRAQIVDQDIGCWDYYTGPFMVPPDNRAELFANAESWGAQVQTNSWATAYDLPGGIDWTIMANIDSYLSNHPVLVVTWEADNLGPSAGTLAQEARAKNVMAIGATGNGDWQDRIPSYSSTGPSGSSIQRLKPNFVAPGGLGSYGVWTGSASLGDDCGSVGTAELRYVCVHGASFATAHAAGAGAMVRQYFLDGFYPSGSLTSEDGMIPSAALVRAVLISGAEPLEDPSALAHRYKNWYYPTLDQGWGRINLDNSLYFQGEASPQPHLAIVDEREGLQTGSQASYRFTVSSATPRLRIALAWTDVWDGAGNLVNDLNMILTAPGGATYRGNNFATGTPPRSMEGGSMDASNNEEMILLRTPVTGEYTLTIRGTDVKSLRQQFAVAVTGDITNFRAVRWHHPKAYAGTEGHAADGSAVALYDVDQNGRLDAFYAIVDDSTNRLRYRIEWNLNEWGSPRTSTVGQTGWTGWRGDRSLAWEVAGLGVALYDIDGNGIVDALIMLVADLAGGDKYYYNLGWSLGTSGYFQAWDDTNRGGWFTGTATAVGGGIALGFMGGQTRIDAVLMVVDDAPSLDAVNYRVLYDLASDGRLWGADLGNYAPMGAGGLNARGGDVALVDLDRNGYMDAVFAIAFDSAGYQYRHRVLMDWNGGFSWATSWMRGGGTLVNSLTDVGVAVGSFNGDSANRPDFIFVATGWGSWTQVPSGNALMYRPAFDMSTGGSFG